ncbi:trypsin-like peptidase domain-containing protein [Candidatus Bathyarchaeota archaeon]|nr:trypsin-like peptidase domain-containing protein [Candidatus Bathyarchaeota archaeon]
MPISISKFLAVLCIVALALSIFNSYLIFNNIQVQQQLATELSKLAETLEAINQTSLANVTEMRLLIDQLSSQVANFQKNISNFINQTPASIYQSTYKSVVVITTNTRLGSGFLFSSSNMILTNWHVVEGETEIQVQFYDGTRKPASIVGLDPYSDVAVLMVAGSPSDVKPLQLGNSSNLYIGQQVVAIGNPLGLTGSLSSGYISQLNEIIELEDVPIIVPVVQLDISLAPGNSGGPLLDMSGNVVGITNAGTSYGFNFAIPSNIVNRVAASLIEKSNYNHPFVGFYLLELTPEVIKQYNILNVESFQMGLLVWEVIENYPAEEAGLQGVVETTDSRGRIGYIAKDIILAVDGHPTRTIAEWSVYVEEHVSPGQTITLTVWRSGVTTTVNVTATIRPPYD